MSLSEGTKKVRRGGAYLFARFELRVIAIIALTAVVTATAVSVAVGAQNSKTTLLAMRSQLEAIGAHVLGLIDYAVFDQALHADSSFYREQNELLDDIRRVSGLKYLYTLGRSASGEIAYLVDGQPPDTPDFCPVGLVLESELLTSAQRAFGGETVFASRITDSGYGPVYISFFPVSNAQGNVVGVLGMEYAAEHLLRADRNALLFSLLITVVISVLMCTVFIFIYKRVSAPFQRQMTYTDFLTGLGNRTAFEINLRGHRERGGARESVVVFDLNNLKLVNDTYGHKWGDEYLKAASNLIQGCFIRFGEAYRVGGDEFAVICPECDDALLEECLHESFEQAVACLRENETDCPPLSQFYIAYGRAAFDPERHGNLLDTFDEADRNMYGMKRRMKEERKPGPPPGQNGCAPCDTESGKE